MEFYVMFTVGGTMLSRVFICVIYDTTGGSAAVKLSAGQLRRICEDVCVCIYTTRAVFKGGRGGAFAPLDWLLPPLEV